MRPIRSTLVLSLLALSLLVAACGDDPTVTPTVSGPTATTGPSTSFPVTITDDDGESVTIDAPPQRIVTFAPSMTEIVFALGLGDELVGVSGSFDDYPPEAADIEEVGGAGDFGVDPNIEQVVWARAGPVPDDQGRRPVEASPPRSRRSRRDARRDEPRRPDGRHRGRGARSPARTMPRPRSSTISRRRPTRWSRRSPARRGVTCFYETFYPPLYTVGPDTFIYDLLERAGCDPVTSSAGQQYPQWSVEDLVDQSPDVYLVSSESGAGPKAVAEAAGVRGDLSRRRRARRRDRLEPGRTARPPDRGGLRLMAEALHPEAFD